MQITHQRKQKYRNAPQPPRQKASNHSGHAKTRFSQQTVHPHFIEAFANGHAQPINDVL